MIGTIARYWHTLRHLRPVQVYGRLQYRLYRPAIDAHQAPPVRNIGARHWVAPAEHEGSMQGPTLFHLVGRTADLSDHGWDDPAMDKLWRYNLHYFADLTSTDCATREEWHRALLVRWVRENPPGVGSAWEPFPTSLRIVNWIKWAMAGNQLPSECVHSLAVQVRWLTGRLERHLMGNHLFANAKALVFAGVFFTGAEAAAWAAIGAAILRVEISEQILPDGGHFERSTMYHALALEDVLDICNVTRAAGDATIMPLREIEQMCIARVAAMRHWLAAMSHPDGEISFFNDAALEIAPSPAQIASYSTRLGFMHEAPRLDGVTRLLESGYVRLANAKAVAVVDVGLVGPSYLPAHAHADTLSFELSLFGKRVIVNSGTSEYGSSRERLRQRGTSAHNTLMLDDANSSDVWSGFRVGRRARPRNVRVHAAELKVEGTHDGYRFLPGAPLHRRSWTLADEALTITDEISGYFRNAEARLHLHPDVEASMMGDCISLNVAGGCTAMVFLDGGTARIEPSTWHPRFGASIANQCIVARLDRPTLRTHIVWKHFA